MKEKIPDVQFQQIITDHIAADRDAFIEIHSTLKEIKENHLHHIEKDIAGVKTDVSWIKRIFFIVLAAAVGLLIFKLKL